MSRDRRDGLRYILWLLLAQTAFANRRQYRMATTWLPHLLTNTLSLLLPDLVRVGFAPHHQPRNMVEDTLLTMVRDNPQYAIYVAPLALGYIVSHPRFNIYKGTMGEFRIGGIGLDAIPHSATAFAFSALAADTFDKMGDRPHYAGFLSNFVRWGKQNPDWVSLALLALITLNWEYGEYQMHQYEMAKVGDAAAINMQWTLEDTARDSAANLFGWFAALIWRRAKKRAR